MIAMQYFPGLPENSLRLPRPSVIGRRFLQARVAQASEVLSRGALRKPRDLIGLLLGHRSTTARINAPRVAITIICAAPSGNPAVEISV